MVPSVLFICTGNICRSPVALFRSRFGMIHEGGIGILGAPGVDLARRAHSPRCEEVSDPYGESAEVYQSACEQIRRLVEDWEPFFREIADRKD